LAMRIPGLVIAEVHLHEIDAGLDEPACHKERPAKRVLAVALLHFGRGSRHVDRFADASVDKQRDRSLAVAVELLDRGEAIEIGALPIDEPQQLDAVVESAASEPFG